MDRKTITASLSKAGIVHEPGKPLTAMQIKTAILGDEKAEKVRNLRLDADLKQLEKDKAEARLYEPELVREMVDKVGQHCRQALLQARAELPARCNPIAPKTALKAIDQWLDRFWPEIRKAIAESVELLQRPSDTATEGPAR